MADDTRRIVVVLGMHRAGTSLCMRLLNLIGVRLSDELMPAAPDNERGFWEDARIFRAHEDALAGLGRNWRTSTTLDPLPVDWRQQPGLADRRRELAGIVTVEAAAAPSPWGFKDPRTAALLPLWTSIFAECGIEPSFVLAVRHPRAVASSLQRRDDMDPRLAELLWVEHALAALEHAGDRLVSVVDYDDWFGNPDSQGAALAAAVGLSWPDAGSEARARIAAEIAPELRHHTAAAAEPQLSLAGDLYRALCGEGPALAGPRLSEFARRLADLRAVAGLTAETRTHPLCGAGKKDGEVDDIVMDLRVDLHSIEDWQSWKSANANAMHGARDHILSIIRRDGIVEPLSNTSVAADTLRIDATNLRESLSFDQLNSRKRALLYEFSLLSMDSESVGSRQARILAAEGVTRAALVLRGLFPFFLGTEYVPDVMSRGRIFPVPHADISDLQFADGSFDVVLAGDLFERVPDLPATLGQIARVLKPGGFLVSTFSFLADQPTTQIRARLEDGGSESANAASEPVTGTADPRTEILRLPGWDILDQCRSAGLGDARMVLHASAIHGILDTRTLGVFVLSARKADAARRPTRTWVWKAERIRRVIGLVGLPRSGTTMLTAVLDAHPDIVALYEPWNANKKKLAENGKSIDLQSLIAEAEAGRKEASTMLIKETSSDLRYPHYLAQILSEVPPSIRRNFTLLLRNPFHAFLSEIEGRRKWWGEGNLAPTAEVFEGWARKTMSSLANFAALVRRFGAVVVSYEALSEKPAPVIKKLMRSLDLPFDSAQLHITENADLRKIKGDMSLVENPRDVTSESIGRRQDQFQAIRSELVNAGFYENVLEIARIIETVADEGVMTISPRATEGLMQKIERACAFGREEDNRPSDAAAGANGSESTTH